MNAGRVFTLTEKVHNHRHRSFLVQPEPAVDTPLRLLKVCRDGVAIAGRISVSANPNVISDLGIGVVMFDAAARSAYLTVMINLPAVEADKRLRYQEQARELLSEVERQQAFVWRFVTGKLKD